MNQVYKFSCLNEQSKESIDHIFNLDTTDPLKTKIINLVIHNELFLHKLGIDSKDYHNTYLDMLHSFGIFKNTDSLVSRGNHKNKNNDSDFVFKEFEIDTYNKFIEKINNDSSFGNFIYDFLKDKL